MKLILVISSIFISSIASKDACSDISPNCAINEFQCHNNAVVQGRCRKTCGLCDSSTELACRDHNPSCSFWKDSNLCSNKNVLKKCPKSCEACPESSYVNVPIYNACDRIQCGENAFCRGGGCLCKSGYTGNANKECTMPSLETSDESEIEDQQDEMIHDEIRGKTLIDTISETEREEIIKIIKNEDSDEDDSDEDDSGEDDTEDQNLSQPLSLGQDTLIFLYVMGGLIFFITILALGRCCYEAVSSCPKRRPKAQDVERLSILSKY
ncbi:unnamed protein product [Meganyctiphanes norvegica]|uniref:ShKT domain-containing protein n=1 Tax=Meganyctiphanes norvegica TaxID=48144 RepID=A0AAV2Q0D7_MEGNR